MENLTNRIDVRLVNNEKYYLKLASKPSYISHKILVNKVLMNYTMITLKINMETTEDYYSQTLIV